jgi:hypothetical protein
MLYLTFLIYILNTQVFLYEQDRMIATSKESWLVKNLSTLKVDGKTNINSFSCIVPSYDRANDVITCEKSTQGCKVSSQLIIPVESFDCYHRVMTKDLQKTLKSHKFPHMVIDFNSFSKLPSSLVHGSSFTGNADIKLAGVSRNYTIQFTSKKSNDENIELIGKRTILFTEFGLTPPSKLGGTIKVKDELQVEFRLFLKKSS